jgi:cytochrome c
LLSSLALYAVGQGMSACAAESLREITLPAETAVLVSSPLPGYAIATQKCAICHSADYINLQPPHMSLAQWTAEVGKMQHSYAAPIDDAEVKLIAIYLASTYGDAATVAPVDTALLSSTTAASSEADVQTLLNHNACLSCHALNVKVVGPAYHDVATRYKDDPQAHSKVEAHIHDGGAGKWGAVPMPPFPGLSTQELQALADFVLRR